MAALEGLNGSSKLGDPLPSDWVEHLPTCFPVHYESQFYDKAVDGRLWSCAAVIPSLPLDSACGTERPDSPVPGSNNNHIEAWSRSPHPQAAALAGSAGGILDPGTANGSQPGTVVTAMQWNDPEELAAAIISQISPQGEFEDMVLQDPNPTHKVAYICTLGVYPAFRKHGLASRLLQVLVKRVEMDEHGKVDSVTIKGMCMVDGGCVTQAIKALALHVLTTNEIALRFYERNGFLRLKLLPNFYCIAGKQCDAYLYARHFHSGEVPCTPLQRLYNTFRDPRRKGRQKHTRTCTWKKQRPLELLCSKVYCHFWTLGPSVRTTEHHWTVEGREPVATPTTRKTR